MLNVFFVVRFLNPPFYHLPCLLVSLHQIVECGLQTVVYTLHCSLYKAAHFCELYLVVQEGCYAHLVGCIKHAGHISTHCQCVVGKLKVGETLRVGLFECKLFHCGEIESFEARRQSCGVG